MHSQQEQCAHDQARDHKSLLTWCLLLGRVLSTGQKQVVRKGKDDQAVELWDAACA
jgi:hypothetical protein